MHAMCSSVAMNVAVFHLLLLTRYLTLSIQHNTAQCMRLLTSAFALGMKVTAQVLRRYSLSGFYLSFIFLPLSQL